MRGLMKYDEARHALAEASTLDEVHAIRNEAVAREEYARRMKDKDLELLAFKIRTLSEHRFGELSLKLGQAKAGRPGKNRSNAGPISKNQVLKQLGVTKQHANRCEKLAEMPTEKFERRLAAEIERAKPSAYRPPTRYPSLASGPIASPQRLTQALTGHPGVF